MRIIVLGSNGMVGNTVATYFKENGHEVFTGRGFDINYNLSSTEVCFDTAYIRKALCEIHPDAVINCLAIVNQAAEDDKPGAVFINSYLPHLLESLTATTKTVIVHRSTDCVFSGVKGEYTLTDTPDAQSFYARTKAVGEIVNEKDITIRVSLIGPALLPEDGSLLNWFLQQKGEVNGFANAIWTGLTTLEYAKVIEQLLAERAFGVFHAAPEKAISKYELLKLFEKYFPNNRQIKKIDNARVDKSLVPDWGKTDICVLTYEEQIAEMKCWIQNHPSLYPCYYY